MELNENKTVSEETAENLIHAQYQRYRDIADVLIEQLRKYEIRYDEIGKVQTCIKAKIWEEALHS